MKFQNYQVVFGLKMDNVENIEYTVYNKDQIVIRNFKDIFGSSSRNLPVNNVEDRSVIFVDLAQVHWKSFDLPGDRCVQAENPNTSQCIEDYVATKSGCHLPPENGDQKDKPICENYGQFKIRSNMSTRIEKMDENQIYDEMGCLPLCEKMSYEMSHPRSNGITPRLTENTILLHFLFEHGRYSVKEKYYIYDTNSLIADIGGYMGLLLGQSVLGLYHIAATEVAKRTSRRVTN